MKSAQLGTPDQPIGEELIYLRQAIPKLSNIVRLPAGQPPEKGGSTE